MKEKVRKKYVAAGAPLWMSQFTAVMLILIVLFMIMCTMATEQTSGMKSGDGLGYIRQKNALGIYIGSGVFRFGSYGEAKCFAPNPASMESQGAHGVHIDLTKGNGGVGNTDLDIARQKDIKYLSLPIRSHFPKGSSALTPPLREDVRRLAIALAAVKEPIIVKSFADETPSDRNNSLALARAEAVGEELSKFGGIPPEKIKCVGYSGFRYKGGTPEKEQTPPVDQLTLVRLYVSGKK